MSDEPTSYWPLSQRAKEIRIQRARNEFAQYFIEARQILSSSAPLTSIEHDEAAERDTD